MEKGLERLMEAAKVAAEPTDSHTIFLSVEPEGVRIRLLFEHEGNPYSLENTTPWHLIHPRPDTKNPLISAMDDLVRQRTEFGT